MRNKINRKRRAPSLIEVIKELSMIEWLIFTGAIFLRVTRNQLGRVEELAKYQRKNLIHLMKKVIGKP